MREQLARVETFELHLREFWPSESNGRSSLVDLGGDEADGRDELLFGGDAVEADEDFVFRDGLLLVFGVGFVFVIFFMIVPDFRTCLV